MLSDTEAILTVLSTYTSDEKGNAWLINNKKSFYDHMVKKIQR